MLGPGEILDCLWLSERAGSSESRRAARTARSAQSWNGLLPELDGEGHQHQFRGIHWNSDFWVFWIVVKLWSNLIKRVLLPFHSVHIKSTVAHQGIWDVAKSPGCNCQVDAHLPAPANLLTLADFSISQILYILLLLLLLLLFYLFIYLFLFTSIYLSIYLSS